MLEIIGELLPFSILFFVPLVMLRPTVTMSFEDSRVGRMCFRSLNIRLSVLDGVRVPCFDLTIGRCHKYIIVVVRREVGPLLVRPVWMGRFPVLGIISRKGLR